MQNKIITLESQNDILQFDSQTLSLVSFRSKSAPDQEFISFSEKNPTFTVGYLDAKRRYRLLDSHEFEDVQIKCDCCEDSQTLTAVYSRTTAQAIRVTCIVKASKQDRFIRFSIGVENNEALEIEDIQFPFILCNYNLKGTPGSETLLLPHGPGSGRLIKNMDEVDRCGDAWKQKLAPDSWRAWEFSSQAAAAMYPGHYPGTQFAQFMAFYNDQAGLYMACDDAQAHIKRFGALHRDAGIRLGVAHVGDWPTSGERTLEYDTVMCSFTGDWYDAADIYREWSINQKWFTPLYKRNDIPEWIIDSPVFITIRPQGQLDIGPVSPVEEFLPYEKCIPLLEKVAEKVHAPLSVVLMGWERAGSWVSPDSFPPVGGEESMKNFIRMVREHGWHAGSFCNGTRWAIGQFWNNYDGRNYFEQHNGEKSVCYNPDGSMWYEFWDGDWRPSLLCCIGTESARKMAVDFVSHLIEWGMDYIQFLDQNCGAVTFPCFSKDHEHPPMPGKWMSEKMAQLLDEFHAAAREAGREHVIQSAEAGLNETCLQLFQMTELRPFPPNYGVDSIPLYQYLFHECVILQGMMGNAPEPYNVVMRNALNCVLGNIPGGVLTGDGTLLDKDTNNWALWEPKVENSENAFEMIRNVAELRQGPGKDFLVYGRMIKPAEINGIKMVEWTFNSRSNQIPAVFHSTWLTSDGRIGIVLANWTADSREVFITDSRLLCSEKELSLYVSGRKMEKSIVKASKGGITVMLPPLSCALIEG